MDDSSKNKNSNPNLHLHDALKNINDALEQWDKITNKPIEEQADSPQPLKTSNQELFMRLKDQLADFADESQDLPATETQEHL